MENTAHQYPLTIKEFHLDTFGHVNNATYLEIYEEARWELISSKGYGLDKIKSTGLGPIILEINLKFLKELRLREHVIIHSKSLGYKGKIGKLKQWITDSEGNICSEVEMVIGLFDTKNRKLIEPTEEWLKAVE